MKKFFYLFFIITIILAMYLIFNYKYNNEELLNQEEVPFKVSKIFFYSGIIPKSTSFSNNNWNLQISQYTDIAIYIENSGDLNKTNTVQSLYIDNINYTKKPKKGIPSLYYQNPLKFATSNIYSDYIFDNHLNYNILNFDNSDNLNYYSTPNFFTDCSNPIVIKYVNTNILPNFLLSNENNLVFNGSILKNSNISLDSLNCQFSFTINIVSNDNKLYKYDANIIIPLSNSNTTLFEDNIYLEKQENKYFKTTKNLLN